MIRLFSIVHDVGVGPMMGPAQARQKEKNMKMSLSLAGEKGRKKRRDAMRKKKKGVSLPCALQRKGEEREAEGER
jgi:hypothetical protein